MGQTLIHNDFNPRNIAIIGPKEHPQLCVFDWELATIQVPQHDLAELLTFVTAETTSPEEIDGYIELHRSTLSNLIGQDLDKATWRRGYELSLQDLAINRIAMYLMAHTFKYYNFMDHIVENNTRLINLEAKSKKS
jgi:aminoglycoside phosphotransferase (APT) family kinase protein